MLKRLTALLLALCLMTGIGFTARPAQAENFPVYVADELLPVYSRASASSGSLGVMSYGESMTCIAYNSSWAAVKNSKGQIGYCKISGLTRTNPNTLDKTAYITSANVPVYRKPDTNADVMMKLNKNSHYTAVCVTPDKKWVRLQNGKYYGYVQIQYVSASIGNAGSSGGSAGNESIGNAGVQNNLNTPVYIVSNTLKAYQSASTSSKVLGNMSYGEGMTLLATSGEWARIRNSSGAVGYCKLNGLSTENPNNLKQKVFINADGVKVYRKPSTSAGVMQVLKRNESYTAVAITPDGAWVRLQNGRYYGYVQAKYVSGVQIEENQDPAVEVPVYISANTLNVYAEPDETSKKLGTMNFGESLSLIVVDDGWAKVRNASGTVGYCMYGGLTQANPNGAGQTVYAVRDGVKLYTSPVEGGNTLKSVPVNTLLTLIAVTEDGEWARLKLSSGYAYVPVADISEQKTAVDDGSIQDENPRTVFISSTTLPCYAENSTSSKVLGTMSFGESLTCTGSGDGWSRVVNSQGKVGYCKTSGLTAANPNTSKVTLYAQSSGVKVYEKASTSSAVLMTLSLNSKVTAVAKSNDGSWVRLYNGSDYGYAKAEFFATSQVQDSQTDSRTDKIVTLAKKQIGVKYVFAAQSPTSGFDCSGFIYYVYKNAAGITLKRTAHTQGYDNSYAKITSRKDLKVGDLVFFNTVDDGDSDLCDHVGIYLGSNKFIHASSAKGEVTISDLGNDSGDYYYRTYSWGRRILK